MAIAKRESSTIVDGNDVYLIQDTHLFDTVVATTQYALDQYDDADFLATRYNRLVTQVRRVVRDALRGAEAERLNGVKPRLFDRALKAYITREVSKRQGRAFEAQLAAEYGPLEQLDAILLNTSYTTINGISIVEVDSGDESDAAKGA